MNKYFLVTVDCPQENGYSFVILSQTDDLLKIWEAAKLLGLCENGDFDDALFDEMTRDEFFNYLG